MRLVSILIAISVASCGGGGGSTTNTNNTPVAPLPSTVLLQLSDHSVIVNTPSTLSWSSTNATSCTASGAWSGTLAASGSQKIVPTFLGTATYNLDCGGATSSVELNVIADTITAIPDPVLAQALYSGGYSTTLGQISASSALTVKKLIITSMSSYYGYTLNGVRTNCTNATNGQNCYFDNTSVPDANARVLVTNGYIGNASGMEAFANLETLRFEKQNVTNMSFLSSLPKLTFLSLWRIPIVTVDLSSNIAMRTLGLSETSLTTVDTSMMPNLEEFDGQQNALPPYIASGVNVAGWNKLNFSSNSKLKRLYISNNAITTIGDNVATANTTNHVVTLPTETNQFQELWADYNSLSSVDFSKYKNLDYIILNDNPLLINLKLGTQMPSHFRTDFYTPVATYPLLNIQVPNSMLSWWRNSIASMKAAALSGGTSLVWVYYTIDTTTVPNTVDTPTITINGY